LPLSAKGRQLLVDGRPVRAEFRDPVHDYLFGLLDSGQ
jgi:hypothetical protein